MRSNVGPSFRYCAISTDQALASPPTAAATSSRYASSEPSLRLLLPTLFDEALSSTSRIRSAPPAFGAGRLASAAGGLRSVFVACARTSAEPNVNARNRRTPATHFMFASLLVADTPTGLHRRECYGLRDLRAERADRALDRTRTRELNALAAGRAGDHRVRPLAGARNATDVFRDVRERARQLRLRRERPGASDFG